MASSSAADRARVAPVAVGRLEHDGVDGSERLGIDQDRRAVAADVAREAPSPMLAVPVLGLEDERRGAQQVAGAHEARLDAGEEPMALVKGERLEPGDRLAGVASSEERARLGVP
jgi:hypothetical protein